MNNWINNLVKKNSELCLNDIILPGTHNSASCRTDVDIMFTSSGIDNMWYANCWPASRIIKNFID